MLGVCLGPDTGSFHNLPTVNFRRLCSRARREWLLSQNQYWIFCNEPLCQISLPRDNCKNIYTHILFALFVLEHKEPTVFFLLLVVVEKIYIRLYVRELFISWKHSFYSALSACVLFSIKISFPIFGEHIFSLWHICISHVLNMLKYIYLITNWMCNKFKEYICMLTAHAHVVSCIYLEKWTNQSYTWSTCRN